MKRLIAILLFVISHMHSNILPEPALEPHSTIIAFDADDVITRRPSITKDWSSLYFWKQNIIIATTVAKIALNNPRLCWRIYKNWSHFRIVAKQASKENSGTANIIEHITDALEKDGYGNITQYNDELLNAFTFGIAYEPTVNTMKSLKEQGYTIAVATNQDSKHHAYYRQHLKEQNPEYDLDSLADITVTCRHDSPHVLCKNWHESPINKPQADYFELLKEKAGNKTVLFFDDKQENIEGARSAGIQAEQFHNKKQSTNELLQLLKKYEIVI